MLCSWRRAGAPEVTLRSKIDFQIRFLTQSKLEINLSIGLKPHFRVRSELRLGLKSSLNLKFSDKVVFSICRVGGLRVSAVNESTLFPVVLFVHAENYDVGTGNAYDGSVLAAFANLVVVTFNFRLGALGTTNARHLPLTRTSAPGHRPDPEPPIVADICGICCMGF